MLRITLRRAKISLSTTTSSETFVCLFCKKAPQLSHLRSLTTGPCLKGVAGDSQPNSVSSNVGKDLLGELRKGIEEIVARPVVEAPKKKKKRSKKEKPVKESAPAKKVGKSARKSKEKKKASRRRAPLDGSPIKGMSLAAALSSKSSSAKGSISSQVKSKGLFVLDPDIETVEPIIMQNHENPPHIHHDLDRVLFNQGVHYLQDPRSRVYNFDPYLRDIMPVTEFNFAAVDSYITSSKDKKLESIAKKLHKKYVGSTSSMTAVLSHFHFLLSHWRGINASHLSKCFPAEYNTFTQLSRAPVAIFLRYKGDGTYAIDADKEFDTDSILSLLGRSLEKMLTLPPHKYEALRKSSKAVREKAFIQHPDTFHYSTLGDFLMRSQLDAYDPRLPGTGMFDLKTRAVVSVRMDVSNFHLGSGYQIKTLKGQWESFEREYFDMIRAAFLKYSLQVRMGRMDGIFVAFHNTERIFGFQYVSLDEMDSTIHEGWGSGIGDREFKSSLMLMNKILDRATERFPEQSIRFHFETRETQTPQMYIIAEPVTENQIEGIQSRNERDMTEFLMSLEKKRDSVSNGVDIKGTSGRPGEAEESEVEEMTKVESEVESPTGETEVEIEMASEVYEQGQQGLGSLLETESPEVNGEGMEAAGNAAVDDETALDAEEEEEEEEGEGEEEEDGENTDEENVDEESIDEEEEEELDKGVEMPPAEGDPDTTSPPKPKQTPESKREILAVTLTTYNIVNGQAIIRPGYLRPQDKWTIEYTITEAKTNERAWNTYTSIKTRRKKAVEHRLHAEDSDEVSQYVKYLRTLSKMGRTWAAMQEKQFQHEVPVVYKAGGIQEG